VKKSARKATDLATKDTKFTKVFCVLLRDLRASFFVSSWAALFADVRSNHRLSVRATVTVMSSVSSGAVGGHHAQTYVPGVAKVTLTPYFPSGGTGECHPGVQGDSLR